MKRTLKIVVLIAGLAFGLGTAGLSYAQITKQQAASIAQSQFEGRVIAVKQENDNGAEVYRVKILDPSGGLHVVVVNVQDGSIISAN